MEGLYKYGESLFSATIAEFGEYGRHCGQGLTQHLDDVEYSVVLVAYYDVE